MADQREGGIAWTDETWNPVRGCTKVSSGCANCFAERQGARFSGPGGPYEGLVKGGRWTGKVRLVPEHLTDPLRWRRPRRVFVNSMSDLFHESLSFEELDEVFGVMAACPRHTFQVLTKRPERMREYLSRDRRELWANAVAPLCEDGDSIWDWVALDKGPLPNVWLGTTCEDQERADERIPLLLETPAAVRFLSLEPLLEPVDLSAFIGGPYVTLPGDVIEPNYNAGLGWVIVGGESGHGARPCDLGWIRSVVEQCRAAGVPCLVKQLGAKPVGEVVCSRCGGKGYHHGFGEDGHDPDWCSACGGPGRLGIGRPEHPKGGDPSEWPADLRVREWPSATSR